MLKWIIIGFALLMFAFVWGLCRIGTISDARTEEAYRMLQRSDEAKRQQRARDTWRPEDN